MRSIKTYIDILRKKGIAYAFRETWRTLSPVSFTQHNLRYLSAHYAQYLRDYPMPSASIPHIIWVCWLQGLDAAPTLVKDCVRQMQRFAPDYEIRVVTSANLSEYVDIPTHILSKLSSGQITYTHFSDILRIFLLAKHGGIWMDSTVLLTGPLPDYVTSGPLFFFQRPQERRHPYVGSSWFIAAAPAHPLALNVAEMLTRYWEQETVLRDYFLFHDFIALATLENKQCQRALQSMFYVSNQLPHTYTEESFQTMPIHKLSYKHAINYHMYI